VKILEKLCYNRVFSITKRDNKDGTFLFMEMCDDYFGVDLTKDEMLQLSEEIKSLAQSVPPKHHIGNTGD